ncbi:MAG TPA: PorP/SprF family type IX secretion system membrane protein [Bacteroidia bacterium]
MKKIIISAALFSITTMSVRAQDFHYTHFYQSPFTLNPALTGVFTGDIRVINNYRSQWSSVTKFPYQTETFSVDGGLFRAKMKNDDYFSGGFSFNNDKAGASKLTTNLYNGAFSFTKNLSKRITNSITVGFMAGYGMRNVNFSGLSWDNQYQNGAYDPSLPSGEPSNGGISKNYMDYSAGLLWNFSASEMVRLKIGAGALHLNRPDIGFEHTDKLYSKYVVHGLADIKLGKTTNVSMQPAFEVALQGPTTLINIGTNFKYVLQDRSKYTGVYNEVAIAFGGWYRVGDAAMFTCRFDYGQFALGMSYDANLSDLTVASSGRGGFEFLFIYTGIFKNGTTIKVSKSRI